MSNAVKGWAVKRIGDLIDGSFAGEWGEPVANDLNDIPVLRSTNFTHSGIIDYSSLVVRNISAKKREQKALKKGDILLEKSGGSPTQPVGRVVYFDKDREFLFSNFTQKLTPSDKADSKYFFYKLYFEYQNGLVLRYQQQTTGIINFQLSEYLNLKTIFPPKEEQQKIAAILTAVDDVIESTQAQINKLKDLKAGMMQELLTKGIGHTEFKNSPVGRIPISWNFKLLKDICNRITDGTHQSVKTVDSGTIPFLFVSCIRDGRILWENAAKITNETFDVVSKGRKPAQGDILYTAVGSYGHAALVRVDRDVTFQRHIALIQPNRSLIYPEYLTAYLNSPIGKTQADHFAIGNAQLTVTLGNLGQYKIPIPPLLEQARIAEVLNSIEEKINATDLKLNFALKMKKSLMQDLLTGKVRVKAN